MRRLLTSCLVLTVAVLVTGCGGGDAPHDFTLQSLVGETVSLADHLKKSVVLLDFSATWCPPCSLAVPVLKNLYDTHEDLQIIAVYLGEPEATVKAYVQKHGIEYTVLLDPDGAVGNRYGVKGIPTFLVIDLEGKVRYRGHDPNEAGRVVGQLLGG